MKLFSWNVNGIRAVLKKGALNEVLEKEQPDIICLQETKAKKDQVEVDFADYDEYWNSAERPGYSGTAIFVKKRPEAGGEDLSVLNKTLGLPGDLVQKYGLDKSDEFGAPNSEGRVLTLEFEKFYLVTVYTPNSKRDLKRLKLRHDCWDPAFLEYLKTLEAKKPVVVCGDFNVAHTEIDLARPKDNAKNAGFTAEEREGADKYAADFLDTFRLLHPDEKRYTWWTHWGGARERNIGWRIDYFFISRSIKNALKSAEIYENYLGSDHCPISIELNFSKGSSKDFSKEN